MLSLSCTRDPKLQEHFRDCVIDGHCGCPGEALICNLAIVQESIAVSLSNLASSSTLSRKTSDLGLVSANPSATATYCASMQRSVLHLSTQVTQAHIDCVVVRKATST